MNPENLKAEDVVMPFIAAFSGGRRKPIVWLTKLQHTEKPIRRSPPIEIGFKAEGKMVRPLRVGESFYLNNLGEKNHFHTIVVQEILSENTFRTLNSMYKLEIIKAWYRIQKTICKSNQGGNKNSFYTAR